MAMTGSLVAACHVLLAVLQAPPARGTLRLYAVGDINLGRHTARERLIAGDTLYSFRDRKSTRLNSSHVATSYAVFCLKKKIVMRAARSGTCNGARPQSTDVPAA